MQERHTNRKKYFDEQVITTEKYVIPHIEGVMPLNSETLVLEIGCGEGGNLLPFLRAGCKRVVGVDMSGKKIENARAFFKDEEHVDHIEFVKDDIYHLGPEDIGQFDIIITRDVLEHIHGQEKFMDFVKKFLKPDGRFFLGFPPWYNPFGGHQQMCENKFLSKLPYFHILPKPIYGGILKLFGESEQKVEILQEIKDTGISIERFERILKKSNYKKDKVTHYAVQPNYEVKFGMKPRKSWKLISSIPFLRNFFITSNYYLVSVDS